MPRVNWQQIKVVAFDNDGTLYSAGAQIGTAVLKAHREYVLKHGLKIETPGIEWVYSMIGNDAKEFYAAMLPDQPEQVQRDFEEFCVNYELDTVREFPNMYDGAEQVLGELKRMGKQLVLVTNGPPRYVNAIWETCGYGRFFSKSYPYGPPDFSSKGERLQQAIAEHGGGPAVLVGDRKSDAEAAEHAGAIFIGAAYGYCQPEELNGADLVIDSLAELYAMLMHEE